MGYVRFIHYLDEKGNMIPIPHHHDHRSDGRTHHPDTDHPERWNELLKDRDYSHSHRHTHDPETDDTVSWISEPTDTGFLGVELDVDVGYEGLWIVS